MTVRAVAPTYSNGSPAAAGAGAGGGVAIGAGLCAAALPSAAAIGGRGTIPGIGLAWGRAGTGKGCARLLPQQPIGSLLVFEVEGSGGDGGGRCETLQKARAPREREPEHATLGPGRSSD